jgi:hypothetical protein
MHLYYRMIQKEGKKLHQKKRISRQIQNQRKENWKLNSMTRMTKR